MPMLLRSKWLFKPRPLARRLALPPREQSGFFLPLRQPEIARNPTVVFVDAPIALTPVIELAGGNSQPMNEPSDTDLGLLRPVPDEIHHLVPHIMRHPAAG